MKKLAAAVLVTLALAGCSNTGSETEAETENVCAELETTVIEGDSESAQAARDSIERTTERLCR